MKITCTLDGLRLLILCSWCEFYSKNDSFIETLTLAMSFRRCKNIQNLLRGMLNLYKGNILIVYLWNKDIINVEPESDSKQ